jgi:hypothetical protein
MDERLNVRVIQEISGPLGKAQAASGLFQRTLVPEPEL